MNQDNVKNDQEQKTYKTQKNEKIEKKRLRKMSKNYLQKRNYIGLNFRGECLLIGKDIACDLPYIDALVNGHLQSTETDKDGYHLVDESKRTFNFLIDHYREWLQLGCPSSLEAVYRKGLLVSCAERLGCSVDFIAAIRSIPRQIVDQNDLYRCYYCDKVFLKGEKAEQKECKYHSVILCECHNMRFGCTRLPFHSDKQLDIADEPKRKSRT